MSTEYYVSVLNVRRNVELLRPQVGGAEVA